MIQFAAVSKEFHARPPVVALSGVSFQCQPGRVFALLGPNGSGKTTALRLIAALLQPTRGTISVCGTDTLKDPERVKRHLGFLTNTTALYDRLTPSELVRYFATLHGVEKKEMLASEEALFARLEITPYASRRIGQLSLGQKQRVSLARALVHRPPVIVLDEPTTGLDLISSRAILDLIRDCRKAGQTILFSTHIMGEVSLLADDVAILHKGTLRWSGTLQQLKDTRPEPSLEEAFLAICSH